MMWEYKIVTLKSLTLNLKLNHYGERGWEAWYMEKRPSVVPQVYTVYLKRKVKTEPVVTAGNAEALGLLQPG